MTDAPGGPLLDEARALARGALDDTVRCGDLETLAALRARLVAKQGSMKALLKRISSVPAADRPAAGAEINRLAREVEEALEARHAALDASAADGPPDATFDPTMPGTRRDEGSLHVVTLVLEQIRAI